MNDERPPSLWWGMWKRFAIAGVLIAVLSGAATATVALNKIKTVAEEVFPKLSQINAPKGLVTPEYGGGPQTFLILGSDRRSGSKNTGERDASPHSDTILLVRFDPEQGQTSVLSIPRDLLVNITTPSGQITSTRRSMPPTRSAARSAASTRRACSPPKRSSMKCFPNCSSTASST